MHTDSLNIVTNQDSKNPLLIMKVFFLLIVILITIPEASSQNSLTIEITNIKKNRGFIEIGVFNNTEDFLNKEKACFGIRLKVDENIIKHTFKQLPKGQYAIAVIHDENNDKELTTNFLGIPIESIGFSNNPTLYFGPPSFERCSFLFQKNKNIHIILK